MKKPENENMNFDLLILLLPFFPTVAENEFCYDIKNVLLYVQGQSFITDEFTRPPWAQNLDTYNASLLPSPLSELTKTQKSPPESGETKSPTIRSTAYRGMGGVYKKV